MIIENNNSVNWKNIINSSKIHNQEDDDHKNIKNIILKKANFNNGGNLPIKVHLMGRSPKNEPFTKFKNKINRGLISSFYIKNKNKINNDKIAKTSSSFQKKNIKIINERTIPENLNIINTNEDKMEEIEQLKELLNDKKDIKNPNNPLEKKEIISFKNLKRYETDSNKNKIEENGTKEINIINKINILNLNINKKYINNINKEKIYNLIKEKNKDSSNNNSKININDSNKESINQNQNNINSFFPKSEQKQENVGKHKIRNILSKNFVFNNSRSRFKTLKLFNSSHISKNNSPERKSAINTITDYDNINQENNTKKNNKNDNEEKIIKSNDNKTINTKTTTSNITGKKGNFINNILNVNSPLDNNFIKTKKVISSFYSRKGNKNELIKSSNTSKSPKHINFYNLIKIKRKSQNLEINKSFDLKDKLKSIDEIENIEIDKGDNNKLNIKFDELILLEERLNDIYIAINATDLENGEGAMSGECQEFFKFYLNSSLSNKLSLLFSEDNLIVIQSSLNLELFIIMFLYHISFNTQILGQSINILNIIFNKLKENLCLIIRQILIYYNNIKFNEIKEKRIIMALLNNSNIYNINNLTEDEITIKINDNCTIISNNTHALLNIYNSCTKNTNNYYNDFMNIFNQLSIIKESDITNYFYNNIYKIDNNIGVEKNQNKILNIFLNYQKSNPNKIHRNRSPYNPNNTENNFFHNKFSYLDTNSFCKDFSINKNTNIIERNGKNNNHNLSFYNRTNINNLNKNITSINFVPNRFIFNSQNKTILPPYIKFPREKNKKYTLILDLDETLVHVKQINQKNSNYYTLPYNQKIINLRPGLFDFLNSIKPYYEIISFSSASKAYADNIIKKIEATQKYFDYNLYREHTILYGKEYVKDITKIGRNIKEIIIVDNLEKNFKLNPDNGIKIAPYFGEISYGSEDNKLIELEKLLILFNKLKYDDIRMAIREYSQFIKDKIST